MIYGYFELQDENDKVVINGGTESIALDHPDVTLYNNTEEYHPDGVISWGDAEATPTVLINDEEVTVNIIGAHPTTPPQRPR